MRRLLLLSVSLAGLLLGSATLIYPFGRDQAEYAMTAVSAMDGRVVYRDVFCVKPPATWWLHALALTLFGHSMLAIRLLDLLWQTGTAIAVACLTRDLVSGEAPRPRPARNVDCDAALAGAAAGVGYLAWYFGYGFWETAQTDGFVSLPISLAVLATLRADRAGDARPARRRWLWFLGGAAIAFGILLKYPIGALLPLLCVYAGCCSGWRSALMMTAGCMILLLVVAALLASNGALGPFLETTLRYAGTYGSFIHTPNAFIVDALVGLQQQWIAHNWMKLSTAAAVVAFVLGRRRGSPSRGLPVLLWWLAALIHYVAQNKFYPYHALPLLAPTAALSAQVCSWGLLVLPPRTGRAAVIGVGMLLLGGRYYVAGYWERHRDFLLILTGAASLEEHYRPYGLSDYSVGAGLDAAAYLRSRTEPDEGIFIWGFEPAVYFMAERPCASRFLYNFPLYGYAGWPELRNGVVEQLEASPPTYIIVLRNDAIPWVTNTSEDSETALAGFPALRDFVERRYRRESELEDFAFFRLDP